jgi:cytochrome c oxidase cbb3-type subunit I/II
VVVGGLGGLFLVTNAIAGLFFVTVAFSIAVLGALALSSADKSKGVEHAWHRLLEGKALIFVVLTILAVLVGGVAEIVPSLLAQPDPQTLASAHPYTALELEGRDIFIREGCYNCHSQMIRPFRFEQQRYGEPSTMSDSQFDHPFQWGSKRTGPDLAREGGKYPMLWHYQHLVDPRSVSAGSNMPPYKFLADQRVDFTKTPNKLHAMQSIGVPYNDVDVRLSAKDAQAQGEGIASDLKGQGVDVAPDSDMVALIAYLQRLGKGPGESRPTINVSMNK